MFIIHFVYPSFENLIIISKVSLVVRGVPFLFSSLLNWSMAIIHIIGIILTGSEARLQAELVLSRWLPSFTPLLKSRQQIVYFAIRATLPLGHLLLARARSIIITWVKLIGVELLLIRGFVHCHAKRRWLWTGCYSTHSRVVEASFWRSWKHCPRISGWFCDLS